MTSIVKNESEISLGGKNFKITLDYIACNIGDKERCDLSHVTFMIPVRIESPDRLRNVFLTSMYLSTHFNTNIIIKEVDERSVYKAEIEEHLHRACPNSRNTITHVFEKCMPNTPFHRTKYLNDMLSMVTTPVVVNYDCDVLLPIDSYIMAASACLESYDVIYPFRFGDNCQYRINMIKSLSDRFMHSMQLDTLLDDLNLPLGQHGKTYVLWRAEAGFCQFFKTESYRRGYRENEEFLSWGPEDAERYFRFSMLGYKIGRLMGRVYHMEHSRGTDSGDKNPNIVRNHRLWEKLQMMDRAEIVSYYENTQYHKDRLADDLEKCDP
jgi:hypothetical protein